MVEKKKTSEGPVRDGDAPPTLIIEFKTTSGEVWGSISAEGKQFSTGSVGFYASGKVRNPKSGLPYQVGANITLIGSKG